jgi:RHS repeat-associated protein
MSPATQQLPFRTRRRAGNPNHASRVDPESSVPGVASPRRNCRKTRCQTQPTAKTRVRRFHRNQQYSITALTDGGGSIVERYAYTAYGQATFADASGTVQAASASNNRYTYTGREWDAGLSLYHYRARMYDAVAGRFISRDPIGHRDGFNLYRSYFVLNGTDPSGKVSSKVNSLSCSGCGNLNSFWDIRLEPNENAFSAIIQKVCVKIDSAPCNRMPEDCKYVCKKGPNRSAQICFYEMLLRPNVDAVSRIDEHEPPEFPPGNCGSIGSSVSTHWIKAFDAADLSDVNFPEGNGTVTLGPLTINVGSVIPGNRYSSGQDPPWWRRGTGLVQTFQDHSWDCCGDPANYSSSATAGNLTTGESTTSQCTDKFDPRTQN